MKRSNKPTSSRDKKDIKAFVVAHKWQLVAAASGLVLVAGLAGYVWYSMVAWHDIEARTDETTHRVATQLETLKTQKQTIDKVAKTTSQLSGDIESMCEVPSLVAWQSEHLSSVRDIATNCQTHKKKLSQVKKSLDTVGVRLKNEQQFAAVLSESWQRIAKLDAQAHEEHLREWKKLHKAVDTFKPHASLADAHKSAKTTSKSMVSSYDALLAAHAEEKRPEYDAAIADIQKNYSKLGEVQNLSVESYTKLLDELAQASSKL